MQAQAQRISREESRSRGTRSSSLNSVAQAVVEVLELNPPTAADPGYWRTEDRFLSMSVGVVRGVRRANEKVRVCVAFDGRGLQDRCKKMFNQKFADDEPSFSNRRKQWAFIMKMGKKVRTERVNKILYWLDANGIDMDTDSVEVHRVSNSFYISVSLKSLKQILKLRDQPKFPLRRIRTDAFA